MQFSARHTLAAYEKTIAVGASINTNPTNPCTSIQADHNGNTNNLPAVVDTRTYFSPFGPELDLVSPSHTSYALGTGALVDPIVAAVETNTGQWIGRAVTTTTTTQALAVGDVTINVNNTNGFAVGEFLLLGTPGVTPREFVGITNVNPMANTITIDAATPLENAYPVGTLISTGPNNYDRTFGGTSHSCPTVAGAAALILSVRPDLTWIQVRDILRNTTNRIDAGQVNATGQWVDNDGDGVNEFSQWYGYGRLDVEAIVQEITSPNWNPENLPDVVVRDNLDDDGTVPSGGWHANSPDIWVRRNDDPIPVLAYTDRPSHEKPLRGQDNYVYMRVKNVGTTATSDVYLRLMITHYPGFEFRYPEEWTPSNRFGDPIPNPLEHGTYLIGEERIDNLAPGDDIIVKMTWIQALIPPAQVDVNGVPTNWHPCILAEVSPHDGPAPVGNTFDVKRDNNLAHKNISIEDPVAGADSFAVAVIAGTIDIMEITDLIIDPSRIPSEYKVFVRIADEQLMQHWLKTLEMGKIRSTDPIGDEDLPKRDKRRCKTVLLDSARLRIECCDGDSIIVHAPRKTQLRMSCRCRTKVPKPNVEKGTYKEKPVLVFKGGTDSVMIPLHLPPRMRIPIIIGVIRPPGQRDNGTIRATTVKANGDLAPGYSIRC